MGIKKITQKALNRILTILRRWPMTRHLSWDILREVLSQDDEILNEIGTQETPNTTTEVWSRQSLSKNEDIHQAFLTAKKRLKAGERGKRPAWQTNEEYEEKIQELESKVTELTAKYEKLLLRHQTLCYNASLLEGGSRLLADPLPDNTRSQQG